MEWFSEQVRWMQWSPPSAIFFILLFSTIIGMAVWEAYQPTISRKGFLPMATTRGERLFMGIISAIGIFLLWIAFFKEALLIIPLALAAIWFFILSRWG